MSPSNYIRKVAIVGAGGNIGSYITKSLLETGRHTVTAVTRRNSESQVPTGVAIAHVDYDKPETIVEALKGQEALIITLGLAGKGAQAALIQAAADADVPWVLPSEWAPDSWHSGFINDIPGYDAVVAIREKITQLGKSSFISVNVGLWYEWCLSAPVLFGIDALKREATIFDDGRTKIDVSTWPQIGRAVAALLSLPIEAEDGPSERCLARFRNGPVYVSSFNVSQRDIFESVLRVTGTEQSDWKIVQQGSVERYNAGIEARRGGSYGTPGAIGRQVYARVFFKDDAGNATKRIGTINGLLRLPAEDLDDATRLGIDLQKKSL